MIFLWVPSLASLAVLANGCKPTSQYAPGELHLVDIDVAGDARKILLYIPINRSAGTVGPGLVSFHGWHANPWADVVQYMNQTVYAEQYGYSLAMAFGSSGTWPSPICCPLGWDADKCANTRPVENSFDSLRPCGWNSGPSVPKFFSGGDKDDVAFAKAAASFLMSEACVDDSRIFALGFSGGSMLANRLACEAADVFHGFAGISGSLDPALVCAPAQPRSYIAFCGTEDAGCFPSVNHTFEMWGKKNGCANQSQTTVTTETSVCEAFPHCDNKAVVEKCLIKGMDDQVPGHNRTMPFGKQPFQPPSNIDAIDYVFKRFAVSRQEAVV